MSLCSLTVSGILKKNPEKRFTPSNIPVTNLTLEVSFILRTSEQSNGNVLAKQIIRVNAWRDLADYSEKNLKAGDRVLIIGRAQINAFTSTDGKKKRDLEIDAVSIRSFSNSDVSSSNIIESYTSNNLVDNESYNGIDSLANTEEVPF